MKICSTFKRRHQNNTEKSIKTASTTTSIDASGTASNYSTFKNISKKMIKEYKERNSERVYL